MAEHEPEKVREEDDPEEKKPEVEQSMLPDRDHRRDAAMLAGGDGDTDYAMLTRAPLGSQFQSPAERVQAVVAEVNRCLKHHRFDAARHALRDLPPGLPAGVEASIRAQIRQAEEAYEVESLIRNTLESAQSLVNRGEFGKARKKVKELPRKPAGVAQVKKEVLAKIDEVQKAAKQARKEIPRHLARLNELGVNRATIDHVAQSNSIDTENALQFSSMLQQMIALAEKGGA
jgi:hypothetical protein